MSSDDHRDVLETKRLEIIQGLNFERTLLLNYLRSNHVFDEEDCEIIMSEKASRHRAGKLIDFLVRKGPEAYQHFLDVIQVENATLYESLTGDKSTSRPSPLMEQLARQKLKDEEGSSFPIQIMAEHLHRTYGDLHNISTNFANLLKEKKDLEEKLLKAETNLEFEKERRNEYEKSVNQVIIPDEDDPTREVLLLHECDDLQKGISDRDVYIIVLQMKLLAEKEECEILRSRLENVEHNNETISRDLTRVSDNYKHEKHQSFKLSECIRLQEDEIQKLEDLKKEVREAKFENIIMREERDSKAEELRELKKWAEALNARYDIVEKEKDETLEKNKRFDNLHGSMRNLQQKLALAQAEVKDSKKRYEILEKELVIFKNQRDRTLEARKDAILERDKACSAKETIQKQYDELQSKHDRFNEERDAFFHEYDALEKRYRTALEELGQIQRELNEKDMEAEHLNRLFTEAEEKNRSQNHLGEIRPLESTINKRDEDPSESDDEQKNPNSERYIPQSSPWRERKLKSLLSSMKIRITGERSGDEMTNNDRDGSSPVSGNMTWQVLQCLLPNLSRRPYSSTAQLAQSLQRDSMLKWKKSIEDKTEGNAKKRASTLPFCQPTVDNYVRRDAEKPLESQNGVGCTQFEMDIDGIPISIRARTTRIKKGYRRSNTTEM